ncbi:MAG: FeoB small GTPase domain-containing protein, partial [Archaeoglobaceae archaeon]
MNKKSLESPYKIFLLAQPNSGKTTLFNTLTGKRCYVANWPGKTVEVFHGEITHHGKKILIVDLPGINSFKT